MEKIITRNTLMISITDNGALKITNNGDDIEIAYNNISSVEDLIATGSRDNIKLAEIAKARGMSHVLGGRVCLTADEAAAVKSALDSHPANIAAAAKREEKAKELADYYKGHADVQRGWSQA